MTLKKLEKQAHARIQFAFQWGRPVELTEAEVSVIYLRLVRLADLERFGEARDWPAITAYCPKKGGEA